MVSLERHCVLFLDSEYIVRGGRLEGFPTLVACRERERASSGTLGFPRIH